VCLEKGKQRPSAMGVKYQSYTYVAVVEISSSFSVLSLGGRREIFSLPPIDVQYVEHAVKWSCYILLAVSQ